MEFKGTKGDWIVGGIENKLILTKNGAYRPNAMQVSCSGEIELKANALLISKAPEMLDMLNKVCKKLKGNGFPMLQNEVEQLIKEVTEL